MLLLAAALAAVQPVPPPALGRTAWIFSTVHHSEWCPAGNVRLDLRTGMFAVTPGAPRRLCHKPGLERPVSEGRLSGGTLMAVRAAYLQALGQGLDNPACRDGKRPQDYVVISNGGTPILVVTNGMGSLAAPDDLTCWSHAANALHETLEETFRVYRRR